MTQSYLSFELDDDFIDSYRDREIKWGFQGENGVSLGEITFIRTYSRIKEDGTKETWPEVCKRVVEGTYSIQKDHATQNTVPWDDDKAQRSAQEMFERMFDFKWLPPGRGLWMMGTEAVHKKGLGAALQNCAFVSTEEIDQNPTDPFCFLMDMSMLGVGVGIDTKGAGKIRIHKRIPWATFSYEIPDSREGWVNSVQYLLDSYFRPEGARVNFDYSKIRLAGSPIKTFGGTSSGPGPLIELHRSLERLLGALEGKLISSRTIVDIANLIGKCVVSGNVRRSAEIALGDIHDLDFASLKDYSLPENEYRMNHGWMSNNSLVAKHYDSVDFDWFANQVARTGGEPGIFWIDRAKTYGRMIDPPDRKDYRAKGTNPCSEQTLESFECCNLVETFPTNHDEYDDYQRTLKFAYLYAKTVTLIGTHWAKTNEIMRRNRRIGCSMSGLAQFVETIGWEELGKWSDSGYKEIQRRDRQYSEWLGIRESIKTTSIKPSGSVSLLAGVTPGVHWPVASTYIRRIRFGKDDPLLAALKDAGYHTEPAIGNEDTTVVAEIPVRGPQIRSEDEVSVHEKLALAAGMQKYWADNQVSVTITFHEDEVKDLASALKINAANLKSISCLPIDNSKYPQMPYQSIPDEGYYLLNEMYDEIDLDRVYNGNRVLEAVGERYCSNDRCEI